MSRKSKAAEFADVGYNITVTGRNVQVTQAMQDYAMDKVSKIERFSKRIIDIAVTMDIQRAQHRVDIVIKFDHIKINSHAITENMYASIDMAVDKIQAQIRRYKSRLNDHQMRRVEIVEVPVDIVKPVAEDDVNDVNAEIEDQTERDLAKKYGPHRIVNSETRPVKLLTFDEAVVKMELSGDPFMIFRSEEDRKLHVIYRREDGNYGITHPEL